MPSRGPRSIQCRAFRTPWRERSAQLWDTVCTSLSSLLTEHELVVIEGAGSPAEINLQASDIVNMRIAAEARAATLIVADIDRGGAFAHLYGTYQLLPAEHRALIRGFVLNKFRGDAALLAPGPQTLEAMTGVPTIGVLPMWREHGLPEEDGVFDGEVSGPGFSIVIVAYPRISNLDEFASLRRLPGVALRWARRAEALVDADLLILPGSKHVASDLEWLRATGIDAAIAAHVAHDRPTLGICGGLQMLGIDLCDPHGVEGASPGLNLLPFRTEYERVKRTTRCSWNFDPLSGYWAKLSGIGFDGYEIRHGRTTVVAGRQDRPSLQVVLPEGIGWQCGQTLVVYAHGLFESAGVLKALFGAEVPTLDDTFDGLADFVERHIGRASLEGLLR